jgi:hypothetical protein
MRRLEHLIAQVRSSTSNKNKSKISDQDMVNYFNLAQDEIQNVAMSVDSCARIFSKTNIIPMVSDQESYTLPSDMYSTALLTSVRIKQSSDSYFPIERITEKERQRGYGYSVIANKIYLSPVPKAYGASDIEITYQRQLARLGVRSGKISGYVSGTGVITLSAGYNPDIGIYDDFFCICDSIGTIKSENLPITTFSSGALTTTAGLTIANGDYVVMGSKATTNSELPDNCERFLLTFVERKIQSTESTSDINTAAAFTAEERTGITNIFSTGSQDAIYPPITNTDYLWL